MARNPSRPVPPGVVKCAGYSGHRHTLVILLDGIPYIEVFAATPKTFEADLATWKRATLPTLKRSDVRFFRITNDQKGMAVQEVSF
jgi:hypothetical protein